MRTLAYAILAYTGIEYVHGMRRKCIRTTDWDSVRRQLREQKKLKQLSDVVVLNYALSGTLGEFSLAYETYCSRILFLKDTYVC